MDGSRSYAAVCCPGPRATQQRTTSTLEYCVLGQMGDVALNCLHEALTARRTLSKPSKFAFKERHMRQKKMKNHPLVVAVITFLSMASAADAKYSGGIGEPNDPYRIATPENLSDVGKYQADWDKHFILTADINLEGVALLPVGKYGQPFTGVFDGNDRIIHNADVNMPSSDFVGLFGYVGSSGQIRNLGVEDVAITGEDCAGGLVGANEGSLTGCYTSGSVNGTEDGDNVGGLVGWNHGSATDCYSACSVNGIDECDNLGGLVGFNSGSVTDCYATGSVNGGHDCARVGGLVGVNEGSLAGCYSTGSVISEMFVGGLVGWNQTGSITACYATGSVEGDMPIGGLVGVNFASIADCYSTGHVEGVGIVGGLIGDNPGTVITSFWDVETSDCNFSPGGTGKTTSQMKDINTFLDAGWNFDTVWWMPPDDYPRLLLQRLYSGGSGTQAYPYRIATAPDWQTLMNTSGDWDKHFILVNDVNLAEYAWMEFETIGKYYGWNDSNNEPFTGVFDGNDNAIWNFTWNSDSRNTIGLFGYVGSGGQIKDLTLQNVDVNAVGGYDVGGLVGFNEGTITYCTMGGSVSGGASVGGLVGGNSFGTITNCYSSAAVSGDWNVGGLVGANDTGTITDCFYTGAISGNYNVGGLVGDNDTGTVTGCYSRGSVSGEGTSWNIGGLVGLSDGEIMDCYSTGSVDGNSLVGGLAGHSDGTIINCYSTRSVSGGYLVGGLVGWNHEGYTAKCYSTGSVSGTGWNVGGLIGFKDPDEGFVRDSFWDIETSGQSTSSGGTGKNSAEMKTMSTFTTAGWDFVEIWGIGENQTYPFLRTEPAGDLSHDKKVDFVDLAILALHWLEER